MSDRATIIEVMARALVRRRIEFNHMDETKSCDPDWLQRAEDSTWEYFQTDAEVVCAALQKSRLAVVPAEPTEAMLEAGMAEAGTDLASEYRAMIAASQETEG